MIKCHINRKKDMVWTKCNGTAEDMMAEAALLIQLMYRGIRKKNPAVAKAFKTALLAVLLDPRSPVWEEEDHAES